MKWTFKRIENNVNSYENSYWGKKDIKVNFLTGKAYMQIYVNLIVNACLSVCLSVGLYVCRSVCLSVYLSVCLYVYRSVCQSVGRSVCQAVGRSVCVILKIIRLCNVDIICYSEILLLSQLV